MFKAKFKTGYGQREIPLEVVVVAASHLEVGQLVTFVPAAGIVPAYIKAAETVSAATHIIAQSDMTLEYGHVPVEDRNYTYSPKVATTHTGGTSAITAATPTKKVALFEVVKEDIIVTEVN